MMTASNSMPLDKYDGMTTTPCSYSIEPFFTSLISSMLDKASYARLLSSADLHIIAILVIAKISQSCDFGCDVAVQFCMIVQLCQYWSLAVAFERDNLFAVRYEFACKFNNRFCGSVTACHIDHFCFILSVKTVSVWKSSISLA